MALRFLAAGAAIQLAAGTHELLKGISYGPVPLKSQDGIGQLPQDDWMADAAVPMWGRSGRGDLRVIRELGANFVRLYGNNPANDHTNFLDEAHREGLWVFPGMSDWPYTQMVPGRCLDTNFTCFAQVKSMYAMNLEKGFLTPDKAYHPSLKIMNLINEPDLKLPPTTAIGGADGPVQMARGIISAFDAVLDAEREAQVTGPLINFTATMSYAICGACTHFNNKPALGQMAQLHDAMHNPEAYGYTPRNDIAAAYRARWTHSFNTQNPATDLQHQFLDDYEAYFPTTPVYIGEYHRVNANQTEDVGLILEHAMNTDLFFGISYFQYQVAYWKGGTEMDFGMFGLGDYSFASMDYFGQTYDIHCLIPEESSPSGMSMANAVARVYGGAGISADMLCLPNPWGVPLSSVGYNEVVSQASQPRMAEFLQRIAEHLGATVTSSEGLAGFAEALLRDEPAFDQVVSQLAAAPQWVSQDPMARCVARRDAAPGVISAAIDWVCANHGYHCDAVPADCNSTYLAADHIFSRYYESLSSSASALTDCSFGGAAMFAASPVYTAWTGATRCVEGASGLTTGQPTPATGNFFLTPSQAPTSPSTTAPDAGTTGASEETSNVTSGETTTTEPLPIFFSGAFCVLQGRTWLAVALAGAVALAA